MSDSGATRPAAEPSWEECMRWLEELPALPLERRAEVIERLVHNSSPGIRQRALRVGAAVLPEETLVGYLRVESDAALRNAGLEILKSRGGRSFVLAVELLRDDDPSVVMQAVQVLAHLRDPRALEPLRPALHHPDPNVAQEAITAVGHLGDERSAPDILAFLDADPWLQLAAVQALGELKARTAVAPLAERLTDLVVGPFAAEALAHIGGQEAFRALADHWLRFRGELDPETSLGLLAHVLEGLGESPPEVDELRASLAGCLRDPFREVRVCAARCLLAMGRGAEDGEALSILADAFKDTNVLPRCLGRRDDLTGRLLGRHGVLRYWGFLLLRDHPGSASAARVAEALDSLTAENLADPVLEGLGRMAGGEIAGAVLDLYLRLPLEARPALEGLLERHREPLLAEIDQRAELVAEDRLVLKALLGGPPPEIVASIEALPARGRIEVISQIADLEPVVSRLPWRDWLREDASRYGDLAARVAAAAGLRDLLPELRAQLAARPGFAVVRALGELGDREAVPALLALLDEAPPILRPVVLEALGRIGGPEARSELRRLAADGDAKLSRIAYKALAECANEEDDEFFRAAIAHSDWYVRLACAEALARFTRPANRDDLARLAADPVSIVAQKARDGLKGQR